MDLISIENGSLRLNTNYSFRCHVFKAR